MVKPTEPVLEIHSGLQLKGQLSMEKDVILTGKFEGDLQTLGCLTVQAGATAIGSIEAGALVLEPGNLVDARVKVGAPNSVKNRDPAKKNTDGKWPLSFKKIREMALGRA